MSHKNLNPSAPAHLKRVAIVLSNPAVSSTTGWPVGFWWAELTHPYFRFTEVGYDVELFSPLGGRCEADAMSDPEDASQWQAPTSSRPGCGRASPSATATWSQGNRTSAAATPQI